MEEGLCVGRGWGFDDRVSSGIFVAGGNCDGCRGLSTGDLSSDWW